MGHLCTVGTAQAKGQVSYRLCLETPTCFIPLDEHLSSCTKEIDALIKITLQNSEFRNSIHLAFNM